MNVIALTMTLPSASPAGDLMCYLGAILALSIPLIIALMIARFRSFFASLWFMACIIQLSVYLIANVPTIQNLFISGNTILNGVLIALTALYAPMKLFHECIIYLLELISSTNTIYTGIVESDIFAFVLYLVLFVLSFIFFHKKKKKKKQKFDDNF